ncbi:ATP-binding protein [Streptomyces sp. NPDC056956]|uniref:ATP-binding protein n=1 Tax=Streptomyces sp. NPDC056956 TaxID=3345980 RepID=UPI0036268710
MKNAEPEHEPTPEPPRPDDHVVPTPPLIPFTEPWEYELHFPRDPRGPAVARTTLKAVLGAHGLGEFIDRAELLTSELTTNAVRYSLGPAAVRLRWTNPVLRVSVMDICPVFPLPLTQEKADAEGGRGLLILDLLADAWGGCSLEESLFGVGARPSGSTWSAAEVIRRRGEAPTTAPDHGVRVLPCSPPDRPARPPAPLPPHLAKS